MEILWVFLYGLKFPISILCGVGIFACFVNFFSARSSGRGDANFSTTLNIGICIAVFWALVYALPAPHYDQKIVYKDRVVQVPVVKKYIAQIQTKTITQRYTQDSRFDYCMEGRDRVDDNLRRCMNFAKEYMQPRIVVQRVNVPVYSGARVVEDTRDQRVKWCMDSISGIDLDTCTKYAFKMEAGPQVLVRYQHDTYQQLFDKCNATGFIPANDPNGTTARNDRIKICGQLAMQASHDH